MGLGALGEAGLVGVLGVTSVLLRQVGVPAPVTLESPLQAEALGKGKENQAYNLHRTKSNLQ